MSEPANDLERALLAAARTPSERPIFYRLLLESPLFAVNGAPATPLTEERVRTTGPNEALRLQAVELDGKPHVAIFSSLSRLQQVISSTRQYVSMNGRDLLTSIGSSHAILNPGSELRKVLSPEEIEAALNGSLLGAQQLRIPAGAKIRLSSPPRFPHALVGALTPLFRKTKSIRAAYLALIHEPDSNVPPHIVVGIDQDGDWEVLVKDVAAIARDVECADQPVDFVQIGEGMVAQYLVSESKPFYRRKLFGLF